VIAFLGLRSRLPGRPLLADAETFKVVKRSFPVVLNEKGELDALKSVNVKCEVEGRTTIVFLIPEGTEVKQGDIIVRLASNEIDEKVRAEEIREQTARAANEAAAKELDITVDQNKSDIRKAEVAVLNAELELEKLREGDNPKMLLDKQLALDMARKQLEVNGSTLADSKALYEQKFLSKRDFQRDEMAFYEAEQKLKLAEIDLNTYKDYTSRKDFTQRTSDLEEAKKDLDRTRAKAEAEEAKQRATAQARKAEFELTASQLAKLKDQQSKAEIKAPASGLVVYDTGEGRWDRRQIAEGAEVFERQTIIKLPDTSRMKVKLRIHEAKTNMISVGQEAMVEIEGVPGKSFTGKVTRVAPLADSQDSWLNPNLKEYDTEVTLDETDTPLKPGVTARVEIRVQEVSDVLAVPVQAVFARQGRQFAFVGRHMRSGQPTPVELGAASDQFVEVRSGLNEGDIVLLAADDSLISKLPNANHDENGQAVEPGKPDAAKAKPQAPAGGQGRRGGGGGGRSGGRRPG
jgi:HlyD family secretion protein